MQNTLFLNNITIKIGHCGFYDYTPEYKGVRGKVVHDYQFFFVREGNARVKIDKYIYDAQKSDMFIFHPDLNIDIIPEGKTAFRILSFHFEARLLNDICLFSIYPIPYKIELENPVEFENRLVQLIRLCTAKEDFYTLKALPLISPMLLYVIECGKSIKAFNKTQLSEEQKRINQVLNYIQENYARNITVRELASLISVSPNYFILFFKKRTGISPAEFLRNFKVEKSKQMLLENMSLNQIANVLNYSDAFHFSRTFKKVTGMSPREYKQGLTIE